MLIIRLHEGNDEQVDYTAFKYLDLYESIFFELGQPFRGMEAVRPMDMLLYLAYHGQYHDTLCLATQTTTGLKRTAQVKEEDPKPKRRKLHSQESDDE